VAALWCGAVIVRGNVLLGMAYTVVVVAATWTVVGRWAVGLSPAACRRVLAATTTLLVAGGFGVTMLVGDGSYLPEAILTTAELAFLPSRSMGFGVGLIVVNAALLLFLIYCFWLAAFGCWDWLGARQNQRRLAWSFSTLLVLLPLPILLSVLGGCYAFRGHGDPRSDHHLWLHCVIHVGMLITPGVIVALLQRHGWQSSTPPPNWLKLVTWGYLCFYAVLLYVALFPINFYIP
jgi:hypothetical protein